MIGLLRSLADPWSLKTALRDLRRGRTPILVLTLAMAFGIGALISILSFGDNLDHALDAQAEELLGADLRVKSRRPMSESTLAFIQDELVERQGATVAFRRSFTSMARFLDREGTRMVRVRAVEDAFPFHGQLETRPPEAAQAFRSGRRALVDAAVLHQFGAEIGDQVRLGSYDYEVVGELLRIPGETATQSLIGPRVFVAYDEVDPDLLAKGSRVRYDAFVDLPDAVDADQWAEDHEPHAFEHDLEYDTVSGVRERWGKAGEDLQGYLSLVAFVAVLLGGLGVGSSLQVHLAARRPTVALLRCLGATADRAFAVFLLQSLILAVLAVALGIVMAAFVQGALPWLLASFIPVEVSATPSLGAVLEGVAVGGLAAGLFTLAPMLPLRRIPPRAALRSVIGGGERDPAVRRLAVVGLLALAGLAAWHAPDWTTAASFVGGLLVALGLLLGLASLVLRAARHPLGRRLPYAWRQGLSNLQRPGNQTRALVLTLGLGVFLLVTLQIAQDGLVGELQRATEGDRANLVFFDIQVDQERELLELIEESGHEVLDVVPIVTMRLREVNGADITELRDAPEDESIPDWVLVREYLCTARAELDEVSERLIEGEFIGRVDLDPRTDRIPVSLEERIAERLHVGLGDELVFDVAGVPVRTEVRSLREVEWRRARPNFFVVFPEGSLDEAPRFSVVLTRAEDTATSARLQRRVVDRFPNVTAIDVQMLLELADELTRQFSLAVRFMAGFSVAAGVMVLIAAMWTSRRHRIQEAALLRTLGAQRAQLRTILTTESVALGATAALAGCGMATVAAGAITVYLFRADPSVGLLPPLVAIGAVVALCALIGAVTAKDVGGRPPLETLREDL